MITVKCFYSNGDTITTGINGTLETAKQYFLGQFINIGSYDDNVQQCIKVELLGGN